MLLVTCYNAILTVIYKPCLLYNLLKDHHCDPRSLHYVRDITFAFRIRRVCVKADSLLIKRVPIVQRIASERRGNVSEIYIARYRRANIFPAYSFA